LAGQINPSMEARDAAALTYYLAEKCLAILTHFTPQPVDFAQWVEVSPVNLWNEEPNKDARETLLTREPVPLICHRRSQSSPSSC
jgi:hypothetical protein